MIPFILFFFGGLAIFVFSVIFLIGYARNRIKREAGDGVGCLMFLCIGGVPIGICMMGGAIIAVFEPFVESLGDIPLEVILPLAGVALGFLLVLPLVAGLFGLLCSAPFFIMAKISAKKASRQEYEEDDE